MHMKRIINTLLAGALLLSGWACTEVEKLSFDPSKATAPTLASFEEGESEIVATFTPGSFDVKSPVYHTLSLLAVNGQAVNRVLGTSVKDNTITVRFSEINKALYALGHQDGETVSIEMAVRASLQKASADNGVNGYIDSDGRIRIADFLIFQAGGDPYARYTQESAWGLVGSFNSWGDNGDEPMYTDGSGIHVAKQVELAKGDEVKFRKDKGWDVNFGYAEGVDSYTLDEEFAVAQGGPNIVIAESGTYYLVLDEENAKAKIVAAAAGDDSLPDIDLGGYEFNDAMAGAETWGIIGPAVLDWNTDVDMEKVSEDPEIWVAKNVPFQEDKFKFRGNDEWGDYDLGGAPEFALDTPLQLSKGGGDIFASPAGVYNVYLYPTYMLVYLTEGSGDAPLPPAKPKAWSLIGHIGDTEWNTDFDLSNVTGDKWVIKNVSVKADDEFKIRADHDWAKSYGGPEANDESSLSEGEGVYKPEIGVEFKAGGTNIRIGVEGSYNVTFNYGDEPTILIEEYKEFPDALYMVGTDFGGWNWDSDGVVKLIPVINMPDWGSEAEGQFWTVRYFKAGNGFKFNSARAWDGGQFGSLETNDGFTNDGDGNVQVPEDGVYLVHIDMKRSILHVEPARIYGIGACFGGWDEAMDGALFEVDGQEMKTTLSDEGELRMYVASEISTSPWWSREFIFFDGVIDYRGDNEDPGDQERVNVLKGQTVVLDFNAGTAEVYGDGEAPVRPEVWSLVGYIGGTSWDTDFDLTNTSGDTWVIRNVALTADDEFKIRADHDWAKSVGGPEENDESAHDAGTGVYKPVLGTAFAAGDKNIRVGVDGVYTITYDFKANTILIEAYTEFPEALYMVGADFGGWDWGAEDVVELTPVLHNPDWGADAPGQFWTIRYLKAGNGFKFNSARAWDGNQFGALSTNEGFTNDGDGNVVVAEDGLYMIHVDLKRSILHLEPARVYGIGDCFGSWDEESAAFTADGDKLVAKTTAAGPIRMYAASSIATSGWWTREFTILGTKLTYRLMDELEPVHVAAGATVTLDFNGQIGTIE